MHKSALEAIPQQSAFLSRLQAQEREVNDRLLSYRKAGFHCSADVLADRLNGLRRRIDEAHRVQPVRSAK